MGNSPILVEFPVKNKETRMDEETKPLILADKEADDSLESWLMQSPRDPAIRHGRSDIQILPLPEGKTHHLFFSHSSADQETVYYWTKYIERHYGISCFLPERDFKPGLPVIKNIENGMAVCLKIVLVLSPDYVDSKWCDYERFLAFTMSMEERRHCIIPVLLHPCNLPSELVRLNYIDAMKTRNVEDRIVEALKDKCELKNILPTTFQELAFEEPNGTAYNLPSQKVIQSRIRGPAWHFKELAPATMERLRKSNVMITEEQFSYLRKTINESSALKYHGIFNSSSFSQLFFYNGYFITCFTVLAILSLSQWALRFPNIYYTGIVVGGSGVATAIYMLTYFAASYHIRRKFFFRLKAKVMDLSIKWNDSTKALIFITSSPNPSLIFRAYNLEPCKEHVKARLMELYDAENTTESQRRKNADETATHHINSYLMKHNDLFLTWILLQKSWTGRHNTYLRKKCVCELVEEMLWGHA